MENGEAVEAAARETIDVTRLPRAPASEFS